MMDLERLALYLNAYTPAGLNQKSGYIDAQEPCMVDI